MYIYMIQQDADDVLFENSRSIYNTVFLRNRANIWTNISSLKSRITSVRNSRRLNSSYNNARVLGIKIDKNLLDKVDLNMSVEEFRKFKEPKE